MVCGLDHSGSQTYRVYTINLVGVRQVMKFGPVTALPMRANKLRAAVQELLTCLAPS